MSISPAKDVEVADVAFGFALLLCFWFGLVLWFRGLSGCRGARRNGLVNKSVGKSDGYPSQLSARGAADGSDWRPAPTPICVLVVAFRQKDGT